MTTTAVSFRGDAHSFSTEWEAYVWLINRFLHDKGDFFIAKGVEINYICSGKQGAALFAPTRNFMNQPKQLSNGWYAETCLNERQMSGRLYLLSQVIGLSSERDYEWHAHGLATVAREDVSTMFKHLDDL